MHQMLGGSALGCKSLGPRFDSSLHPGVREGDWPSGFHDPVNVVFSLFLFILHSNNCYFKIE